MIKPAAVTNVDPRADAAKPEAAAVVAAVGEATTRQSGKVFMQTVADDNGALWMRKASLMNMLACVNLKLVGVCGGMTNCGATS